MTLKKLHYISGITITIFIVMHLFNHFVSIYGAEKHIEVMNTLRTIYRNIFIETILLAAISIQILSGLNFFIRKRRLAVSKIDKLQIWTGLYLAIFFTIHLSAILIGRYWLHLDTNFYFGATGINTFPFNLFFIPYYVLAITSFFGHIVAIHSKKMKKRIFCLSPVRQAAGFLIAGIILTLFIFYGLTNKFKGVKIPREYHVLVGK